MELSHGHPFRDRHTANWNDTKGFVGSRSRTPPLRATPFNQHSMQDFLEAQDLRMIKT